MIANPEIFRFGYYQISTGSGRNYDHINDTLEAVLAAAGQVSAIPFKLRVVEQSATYLEAGQRKQTKKFFLQLEPPPEIMLEIIKKQREGLLRPALTGPTAEEQEVKIYAEEAAPPPYAEEGGPAGDIIEGDYEDIDGGYDDVVDPDDDQLDADIAHATDDAEPPTDLPRDSWVDFTDYILANVPYYKKKMRIVSYLSGKFGIENKQPWREYPAMADEFWAALVEHAVEKEAQA